MVQATLLGHFLGLVAANIISRLCSDFDCRFSYDFYKLPSKLMLHVSVNAC